MNIFTHQMSYNEVDLSLYILVRDNRLIFSMNPEDAVKRVEIDQSVAIYLTDVIIGDCTTGTLKSKLWPEKNKRGPGGCKYYESVDINSSNPEQFVVYSEAQVYPAFCIMLRRKEDQSGCVLS